MKRVYLILTLFIISFFLLSSNVSADVIEIREQVMDVIKNEDFLKVREKAINYCKDNNKYYVISYSSTNKKYMLNFYDKDVFYVNKNINNFYLLYPGNSSSYYSFENNELIYQKETSSGSYTRLISGTNYYDYNFLDNNFDSLEYKVSTELSFHYNGSIYTINQGDRFPSSYEIYLNLYPVQEEKEPKAEIVTNFYVLVIDKIKLLTNYIATDYIILSALVIFIFVAVIGLVRRLK